MIVTFRILSYWRIGTGRGDASTLDSRCARDRHGLPFLPGRSVRGLLREAVREASEFDPDIPDRAEIALFGSRAKPGEEASDVTRPGTLRVEDATLGEDETAALMGRDDLIAGLFAAKRATAMEKTGTARPHSLRFDEVALPVTLQARISPLDAAPSGWEAMLGAALPLIRAIGSHRTRGLGRVIVTGGKDRHG